VTADDDISAEADLTVIALTTTFTNPPPDFCLPVAWHPRGHPVTRLQQRTAAVVNWLSRIRPTDIVGFGGEVPSKTLQKILAKLEEIGD